MVACICSRGAHARTHCCLWIFLRCETWLRGRNNEHTLHLSPVAAVPALAAAFGTPLTPKRTHCALVLGERSLVSWRVFPRQPGQRACPCVSLCVVYIAHSRLSPHAKVSFSGLVCGSNGQNHVASAATGWEVWFIACKNQEIKTWLLEKKRTF